MEQPCLVGGVALSTHQAAQGTSNLRARCQKGAPRQPSMLARYLHAARGVPVEGFHLSKYRTVHDPQKSLFRPGTYLLKYLGIQRNAADVPGSSSVSRS